MPGKKRAKQNKPEIKSSVVTEKAADTRRGPLRWGVLLVIGACVLAGLGVYLYLSQHKEVTSTSKFAEGYVDPAKCVTCHADVAETFHHTGMGNSIFRPNGTNMPEDFGKQNTYFHRLSGDYYTMLQRGSDYYQRRYQIGFDGKETNAVEERIDYVIGSGDQARSYLHRSLEGKLIELPITWYSENGGYWAMTPGYDGSDQKDFHGIASKECIFCHDAYPQNESKAIESSGEPIFTQDLPQGIDCQRCHGPGAQHIQAATTKKRDENLVRSTIVNPAHLTRERQMEVCMECHLSTSGSQDENISLRPGRGVFSYRPGEALSDYKLYFDSTPMEDKQSFPIADAAYRLRMSTCFRESSMTCLTCHDPHEQLHGSNTAEHYIEKCKTCHQAVVHKVALPAKENCLTCHMPRRRGEFAIHTVLTDHYIQRERPLRDLLAPISFQPETFAESRELKIYYPDRLSNDGKSQLDQDVAMAENGIDIKEDAARLENDVKKINPPEANYYAALGRAFAKAGNSEKAIQYFAEAIRRDPSNHAMVGDYSEALMAVSKLTQAKIELEKLVNKPPADSRLLTNLGNIQAQLGNYAAAEVTLHKSLSVEPELGQTYNLLGRLKEIAGDSSAAEDLYRTAIRYRPDLAEAHVSLAKLLTANSKYDEAEYEFGRGIASDPKMAEAHHAYGLLLLLQKSYSKAESELKESIRLEPNRAIQHSDLADLLAQMKHLPEANEEYHRALSYDSNLGEANLGLGLLLMQEGHRVDGLKYCSQAATSTDPSIQGEAQNCLNH